MGIFSKIKKTRAGVAETAPISDSIKTDGPKNERIEERKNKVVKSAKKVESKVVDHTQVASDYGHHVLIKPIITEKSAALHGLHQYVFQISGSANKVMVKKAMKEVFGVDTMAVRIISISGKKIRRGRRFGQRSDVKKAIVTLPKGQSIKVYEGV